MSEAIIRKVKQVDLDAVMQLQKQWEEEKISYGFSAADKAYLEDKVNGRT